MSQEHILNADGPPRVSFATNHEDILLDRLFGDHVGTFVDVGARGPTIGSLTYFFYRRGWRGVNIAPAPRRHAMLQQSRPGDLNLPLAAWDSNGEIPLVEFASPGADEPVAVATRPAGPSRPMRGGDIERGVPVRTIRSLVEELGIDAPDFLVIDTGGNEEPVIRGTPLERWRPRLIVAASPSSSPAWEPLLSAHGYLLAVVSGTNRIYLRSDLRHLRPLLERPLSGRDRFRRAEVVALEERARVAEREAALWSVRHAEGERSRAALEHRHQSMADRLEQAERARASWQRECEALRSELADTQRTLRPYRLIDQLGVVTIGYRWARRLKPSRAS
jgi:FkbM family methyltransferase